MKLTLLFGAVLFASAHAQSCLYDTLPDLLYFSGKTIIGDVDAVFPFNEQANTCGNTLQTAVEVNNMQIFKKVPDTPDETALTCIKPGLDAGRSGGDCEFYAPMIRMIGDSEEWGGPSWYSGPVSFDASMTSVEACQAACQDEWDCHWFSYEFDFSAGSYHYHCYLKREYGAAAAPCGMDQYLPWGNSDLEDPEWHGAAGPKYCEELIDPSPACDGPLVDLANVEIPFDGFEATTYTGAFSPDASSNWLIGWSYLDCVGKSLANGNCPTGDPNMRPNMPYTSDGGAIEHSGLITSDETWLAADIHVLTGQTFVTSGVTLTIEAGATIYGNQISDEYTATECSSDACTNDSGCIFIEGEEEGDEDVCKPFTSVLVVQPGATIMAEGTVDAPITFTANKNTLVMDGVVLESSDSEGNQGGVVSARGNWGGLIILGNAPVKGGTFEIEGLTRDGDYSGTCGGTDVDDNSGVLQYVRVWHAGAKVGADNEINGITFGAVGAGTTVSHCEVALNADDGFEFFGGTVNADHLSVLFSGDDGFDTDKKYVGKLQYLFMLLGSQGNHGSEMDGDFSDPERSAPQVMSVTMIGSKTNEGSSSGAHDAMMRLREGTGGLFGNIAIAKKSGVAGIKHDRCQVGKSDTSAPSGEETSQEYVVGFPDLPDFLFVSPKIVMGNVDGVAPISDSCGGELTSSIETFRTPLFTAMSDTPDEFSLDIIDPRPIGPAVDPANVESAFEGFESTDFSGAFAPYGASWLVGWSYLDCVQNILAEGTCSFDPNGEDVGLPFTEGLMHSGLITSDEVWSASDIHILTGQVFVTSGVTLTILPGTVIYANEVSNEYTATECSADACNNDSGCIFVEDDATCKPFTTVLVIQPGARLMAAGTADAPITFTGNKPASELDAQLLLSSDTEVDNDETVLSSRGNWGGLIILGNAPVKGGTFEIEGLTRDGDYSGTCGGTDVDDNSGVLQYVRVWHAGAKVGADNEINGITFGAVGAGTTLDHCEVALNADDGFEFFGGTISGSYLSTLYVADDSFDTDKMYVGKLQYLFTLLGSVGNHACEMDGDYSNPARSAPQIMGLTAIGSKTNSGGKNSRHDTLFNLKEGTGGLFGNIVLSKKVGIPGVKHSKCTASKNGGGSSGETTTQSFAILPDVLYVSPKTIMGNVDAVAPIQNKGVCASPARGDGLNTVVEINDAPMATVVPDADEVTLTCIKHGMDAGRPPPGYADVCDGFTTTFAIVSDVEEYYIPSWVADQEDGDIFDPEMNSPEKCQARCANYVAPDGSPCEYFSYEWEDVGDLGLVHECFLKASRATLGQLDCPEYGVWSSNLGGGTALWSSGPAICPIFDPRPGCGSALVDPANIEAPFNSYFEATAFSGAFDSLDPTWLQGWSYMDCVANTLAGGTCTSDPNMVGKLGAQEPEGPLSFTAVDDGAIEHSGLITSDETWLAADVHVLTGQTFVTPGVTLTIEAGATIYGNTISDEFTFNPDGECTEELCNNDSGCIFTPQEGTPPAPPDPYTPPLFFVEIAEGSSNNKYYEIYNGGNEDVNIGTYALASVSNGPSTPGEYEYWNAIFPDAIIPAGGSYIVCHPQANDEIQAVCDVTFQFISNGDDGQCLVEGSEDSYAVADCIGNVFSSDYTDPGAGFDICGLGNTQNARIFRNNDVTIGTPDFSSANADSCEWTLEDYTDAAPTVGFNGRRQLASRRRQLDEYAPASCQAFTSVLVVQPGATIMAEGTVDAPITFTANVPAARLPTAVLESSDSAVGNFGSRGMSSRGQWGGLIILGNAPVKGGTFEIEGLTRDGDYSGTCGGTNVDDNSGVLQYVRVWHAGAKVGADNEINGITFGAVGAGTTVSYCEVAYNADDGFEFFGGTVNADHLSVLFSADDSFDTDKMYVGKLQYLFTMMGTQGHHATEMDGDYGDPERSAPQVMSFTAIASTTNVASSSLTQDAMMNLKEGTGGLFGNIFLSKVDGTAAIKHDKCTASKSGLGIDGVMSTQTEVEDAKDLLPHALFVSPTTLVYNMDIQDEFFDCRCTFKGSLSDAVQVTSNTPMFAAVDDSPDENYLTCIKPGMDAGRARGYSAEIGCGYSPMLAIYTDSADYAAQSTWGVPRDGTFLSASMTSPEACQALCAAYDGCEYFSYEFEDFSRYGWLETNNYHFHMCYLKAAYDNDECAPYAIWISDWNSQDNSVKYHAAGPAVCPVFDPRPACSGPLVDPANVEGAFPGFQETDYAGAFGPVGTTWLTGWSYLDCVANTLADGTCYSNPNTYGKLGREDVTGLSPPGFSAADCDAYASSASCHIMEHSGLITSDETWLAADIHVLTGQTFVTPGATLTIEAGATIYGNQISDEYTATECSSDACTNDSGCIFIEGEEEGDEDVCKPFTSVLIVQPGATIMAEGTVDAPITFTANVPAARLATVELDSSDTNAAAGSRGLTARGHWGGLIILGNAPVKGGTFEIEGLTRDGDYSGTCGGTDVDDNSGVLQYVRVWHAGAKVGADNEINGITFGAVGAGTTVSYCEVAYNADDGFEFFGGTVNADHLSVLFSGDDGFDTDKKYVGKLQYLFMLLGSQGNHGSEMDGDFSDPERSAPQVMSVTMIGSKTNVGSSGGAHDAMMRLREGTGGLFGNIAIAKKSGVAGVKHDRCQVGKNDNSGPSGEETTQVLGVIATCSAAAQETCDLPYDEDDSNVVDIIDLLGLLSYFNVRC